MDKKNCIIDKLIIFVNELTKLSTQQSVLANIWAFKLLVETRNENVYNHFVAFLNQNTNLILNRDDSLFLNNQAKNLLITQIGNLWVDLPNVDKHVVWEWLIEFTKML